MGDREKGQQAVYSGQQAECGGGEEANRRLGNSAIGKNEILQGSGGAGGWSDWRSGDCEIR